MATITSAQQTAVANLYIALFNRAPDAAGLEFWATALSNGASLSTISQSFLANAEAKVIYPGAQTSEQFVTAFYQTVFGRTVDTAGLAFWAGVLNAAGGPTSDAAKALFVSKIVDVASTPISTRPDGLTDALYAQTLLDRDTFAKKMVIAIDFAVIQKSNDLAAAKLAFVVSTPTTPEIPTNALIRLTTATDTKTTGAGDDTFDGARDASVATLNDSDSLDGGAGTDTLNVTLASSSAVTPTLRNIEIVNLTGAAASAQLDLGSALGVTQANIVGSSTATTYIQHVGTAALSVADQNFGAGFNGSTAAVLSLSLRNLGVVDLFYPNISLIALGGAAPVATTFNIDLNNVFGLLETGTSVRNITIAATGVNVLTLRSDPPLDSLTVTGSGSVDLSGIPASGPTTFTAGDGGVKLSVAGTRLVTLTTGAGADTIGVNPTNLVTLNVGGGDDVVTINYARLPGTARLDLGAGNDTITLQYGSAAGATINGGAGDDVINTKAVIAGSLETLTGGTGNDTFAFGTADVNTAAGAVTAIITDFLTGADKIRVTMSGTNYAGSVDTLVKGGIFNSLADLLTAATASFAGVKVYYVAQFGSDSYLVTDANASGYTNVIKLVGVAVADGIVAADLIGTTPLPV